MSRLTWEWGHNDFTNSELQELYDASVDQEGIGFDRKSPPGPDDSNWSLSDSDLVKRIRELNSQRQPTYWWRKQYAYRMCEAQCARRAVEYGQD